MDGNGTGSRWDLLLHPVRTRIVAEFSGRRRTVRELAAALPDVPQTTLYRQVGVLEVATLLRPHLERLLAWQPYDRAPDLVRSEPVPAGGIAVLSPR